VESARADVDEESNLILDIFMVKDVETQRELPQERFSEIQDQILTKLAERRNRMKRSTSLVGNDPRLWEQVGLCFRDILKTASTHCAQPGSACVWRTEWQ
jgi:hypothetical protein